MITLRPAEYLYLYRPILGDGTNMLKAALLDLFVKGHLKLERRLKDVDRSGKKRVRYQLVLDHPPETTHSKADQFILAAFENKKVLWVYEFRNYVVHKLNKEIERFRKNYIYPDLIEKKLLVSRNILSAEGRAQKKQLQEKLDYINKHHAKLVEDLPQLSMLLAEIGCNMVLLDKDTLDQFKVVSKEMIEVGKINFDSQLMTALDNSNGIFGTSYAFDTFDSIGTFDSFDFSGDSGSDFGGGHFDGDGGGHSW